MRQMITRLSLLLLVLGVTTGIVHARKTTRIIDALKVTYKGDGTLKATSSNVGDYVYKIEITGISVSTSGPVKVTDELTIRPTSKSRNSVFIDSITADGPLRRMSIKLPPGKDGRASCVRNITVNGALNHLTLIGGDLGAPDGRDGDVRIHGSVKNLIVKGKKYKVPGTKATEWWGGNIWADIRADGGISKILAKGGNIYYARDGSVLGAISVGGDIKLLAADGVVVKTDTVTRVMYGGGINADVYANNHEVRQIRAKGGVIIGGAVYCRQVRKLVVKGQRALDPRPFIPLSEQGIFNVLVETTDPNMDYKDCSLKNITVKNGALRDCIFVSKGDLNAVKVTGETGAQLGTVSNVIIRVGYDGEISENEAPTISPETFTTGTVTESRLVIPFTVDTSVTNETLTVRIHNRGPALAAVISNYYGHTFSGTNQWRITDYPESGMFVWITADYNEGYYSNIVVRVRDDGTPNKYDDLKVTLSVTSSNVAPVLTLDPPDDPRIFSLRDETNLAWTATVFDMNIYDTITFTVANDTLGLSVSNLTDRSYYIQATNVVVGTYSNITFTATDDDGLSDSKTITVYITSNAIPVVTSSLPGDQVTCATSNKLEFLIMANDSETNTLTFLQPSNLPSGATYTQAVYTSTLCATNRFEWTPGASQTGSFDLTFLVYDSNVAPLTGQVAVVITVTNSSTAAMCAAGDARDRRRQDWIIMNSTIIPYPGNIGRISVVDDVYDSQFIGGAKDVTPGDWANASYLGRIKSVQIQGTAVSNTFVSLKPMTIWQGDLFDFVSNYVWINAKRATDKSQK